MNKAIIFIFVLINSISITSGQLLTTANLTAKDILLKSIEFSGGMNKLDSVSSAEFEFAYAQEKDSILDIAVKKIQGKSYFVNTLAEEYDNSTTIYHQGQLAIIKSNKIDKVENKIKLDELELQTYVLPEYGYYKLNYTLERLEDQNFKNYDCYAIKATSSNGWVTYNYFDKSNFRLLMIYYPSGRKTVFMEYEFEKGINTPTQILHIDENNHLSSSFLKRVVFNEKIEPEWFMIPNKIVPPTKDIKEGKFIPSDHSGSEINRTKHKQIETYNNGNSQLILGVKWINDYEFKLTLEETINAPGLLIKGDVILVKILFVYKDKYFCHYTSKYGGGTKIYLKK